MNVNKMALLKRKNRRRNLIKKLSSIVTIAEESFLAIEANDLFCKKVFEKLATIEPISTLNELHDQENTSASIKLLKEVFVENDFSAIVGRVLFFRDEEIEAAEIKAGELQRALEEILDITKFTTGYSDFIFITDDLKFGICIERTEYQYEFYRWGV